MGPVIERIAQRVWHGGRPGLELGKGIGIPRAEFFGNPIGPHRPPLVMIAFEPYLKQVLELPIFRNVPWREMAMVIENRLLLRELMIQAPGDAALQKKLVVDKAHTVLNVLS